MTRRDGRYLLPSLLVCLIGLGACAANSPGAPRVDVSTLPFSARNDSLQIRVEARPLVRGRINVVMDVLPRRRLRRLVIDLTSRRADLRVQPARCVLEGLSPPIAPPSRRPPYALPHVAQCSWVLSDHRWARTPFPLRVHVKNATGRDVIGPFRFTVSLPGESR